METVWADVGLMEGVWVIDTFLLGNVVARQLTQDYIYIKFLQLTVWAQQGFYFQACRGYEISHPYPYPQTFIPPTCSSEFFAKYSSTIASILPSPEKTWRRYFPVEIVDKN